MSYINGIKHFNYYVIFNYSIHASFLQEIHSSKLLNVPDKEYKEELFNDDSNLSYMENQLIIYLTKNDCEKIIEINNEIKNKFLVYIILPILIILFILIGIRRKTSMIFSNSYFYTWNKNSLVGEDNKLIFKNLKLTIINYFIDIKINLFLIGIFFFLIIYHIIFFIKRSQLLKFCKNHQKSINSEENILLDIISNFKNNVGLSNVLKNITYFMSGVFVLFLIIDIVFFISVIRSIKHEDKEVSLKKVYKLIKEKSLWQRIFFIIFFISITFLFFMAYYIFLYFLKHERYI